MHYNPDNSYLVVNGKEILNLKPRKLFNRFSATKSTEISLNQDEYDFTVYYNSVGKSDILTLVTVDFLVFHFAVGWEGTKLPPPPSPCLNLV